MPFWSYPVNKVETFRITVNLEDGLDIHPEINILFGTSQGERSFKIRKGTQTVTMQISRGVSIKPWLEKNEETYGFQYEWITDMDGSFGGIVGKNDWDTYMNDILESGIYLRTSGLNRGNFMFPCSPNGMTLNITIRTR